MAATAAMALKGYGTGLRHRLERLSSEARRSSETSSSHLLEPSRVRPNVNEWWAS